MAMALLKIFSLAAIFCLANGNEVLDECKNATVVYDDEHMTDVYDVYNGITLGNCSVYANCQFCMWTGYFENELKYGKTIICNIDGGVGNCLRSVQDQFSDFFPVSNLTVKNESFCDGNRDCSEFTLYPKLPGCPHVTVQGSLLLPNCTLNEVVESGFHCLGKMFEDFPDTDRETCINAFDQGMLCLGQALQSCTLFQQNSSIPCPSMLSSLLDPSFFQAMYNFSTRLTTANETYLLLTELFGDQLDFTVLKVICSEYELKKLVADGLSEDDLPSVRFGEPYCYERAFEQLLKWALDADLEALLAKNHQDTCLVFDKLQIRTREIITNRCFSDSNNSLELAETIGPYHAGFITSGISYLNDSLSDYVLPNCNETIYKQHRICEEGFLATDGTVAIKRHATIDVCQPGQVCRYLYFELPSESGQTPLREAYYGSCVTPNVPSNISCQDYSHIMPSFMKDIEFECSEKECDTFLRCTDEFFQNNSPPCPNQHHDHGVQLLPGCTDKEFLHVAMGCFEILFKNVPYQDSNQCRNDLNHVSVCFGNAMLNCMRFEDDEFKPCPSYLEKVFPNVTEIYLKVQRLAFRTVSFDGLVEMFNELLNNSLDLRLYQSFCSANRTQLEQVAAMLGSVSLPTLGIGSPVCTDSKILDDALRWLLQADIEALLASSPNDTCLAVDKFKVLLIDALTARCLNPMKQMHMHSPMMDLNEAAAIVNNTINFLENYNLPGCEEAIYKQHRICEEGFLATDGTVVIKRNAKINVCQPGQVCRYLNFELTSESGKTLLREAYYGSCVTPNVPSNISCENYSHIMPSFMKDIEFECSEKECDTFLRCTDEFFQNNSPPCPNHHHDHGVQLLPGCTDKEFLHVIMGCFEILFKNVPYQDSNQCRNDLNHVSVCFGNAIFNCMRFEDDEFKPCPSYLEKVFPNVTEIYLEVQRLAFRTVSFDGLVEMFNELLNNSLDLRLYQSFCSANRTQLEQVAGMLGSVSLPTLGIGSPVCTDSKILDDALRWLLQADIEALLASSPSDTCLAVDKFKTLLIDALTARCLNPMKQMHMHSPMMDLNEAAAIVNNTINFLENYNLPGCEDTMSQLPDCSQFYEMTSSCGRHKAWLCDYIVWKVQFMTVWMEQFQQYVIDNGLYDHVLPTSTCIRAPADNLCVDPNQLRYIPTNFNCGVHFCMDSNYRDPAAIMRMWRPDYEKWQHVMTQYNYLFNPYGSRCDNGH